MTSYDHALSLAMEERFFPEEAPCDGCDQTADDAELQKQPVTGELLCPECWARERAR